jgi:hypothetical protein
MKMTVFWDIALCSVVDINQCFRGTYCLHHQGYELFISLMIEAVSSTERSVSICQTAQCYISGDRIKTCEHEDDYHQGDELFIALMMEAVSSSERSVSIY